MARTPTPQVVPRYGAYELSLHSVRGRHQAPDAYAAASLGLGLCLKMKPQARRLTIAPPPASCAMPAVPQPVPVHVPVAAPSPRFGGAERLAEFELAASVALPPADAAERRDALAALLDAATANAAAVPLPNASSSGAETPAATEHRAAQAELPTVAVLPPKGRAERAHPRDSARPTWAKRQAGGAAGCTAEAWAKESARGHGGRAPDAANGTVYGLLRGLCGALTYVGGGLRRLGAAFLGGVHALDAFFTGLYQTFSAKLGATKARLVGRTPLSRQV